MDKWGGKEWNKLHIDCDPNIVNIYYILIQKKTRRKLQK